MAGAEVDDEDDNDDDDKEDGWRSAAKGRPWELNEQKNTARVWERRVVWLSCACVRNTAFEPMNYFAWWSDLSIHIKSHEMFATTVSKKDFSLLLSYLT